jgi:hypothetical protein
MFRLSSKECSTAFKTVEFLEEHPSSGAIQLQSQLRHIACANDEHPHDGH